MLIPEALHASGFGVIETVSMRHQRFTYVRLSHSHMPCLVHDFSMSFTTVVFGRSSTWLFGASTYMVDSEGPSFIFRTT